MFSIKTTSFLLLSIVIFQPSFAASSSQSLELFAQPQVKNRLIEQDPSLENMLKEEQLKRQQTLNLLNDLAAEAKVSSGILQAINKRAAIPIDNKAYIHGSIVAFLASSASITVNIALCNHLLKDSKLMPTLLGIQFGSITSLVAGAYCYLSAQKRKTALMQKDFNEMKKLNTSFLQRHEMLENFHNILEQRNNVPKQSEQLLPFLFEQESTRIDLEALSNNNSITNATADLLWNHSKFNQSYKNELTDISWCIGFGEHACLVGASALGIATIYVSYLAIKQSIKRDNHL